MKQTKKIIGALALIILIGGAVVIATNNDGDSDDANIRPNPHDPSTLKPGTNTGGSNVGGTISMGGTAEIGSYTIAQVSVHNSSSSCWTAINGGVYDVTSWINQHPGDAQAILSLCGRDGSDAFDNQHGGQRRPEQELASFKIGTLQ